MKKQTKTPACKQCIGLAVILSLVYRNQSNRTFTSGFPPNTVNVMKQVFGELVNYMITLQGMAIVVLVISLLTVVLKQRSLQQGLQGS
jgi:hypothetical protein